MYPFSPEELRMRAQFQKHPELGRQEPIRIDDLPLLAGKYGIPLEELDPFALSADASSANVVPEEAFFDSDENITLIRHARYLLPIEHQSVFFEVKFVRNGHCDHLMNGRRTPLEKGDLCIIAPGTRQAASVFSDETEMLVVMIRKDMFHSGFFGVLSSKDVLSAFFSHALYSTEGSCLVFHTGADSELDWYFDRLAEESSSRKRYRNRMMENLLSAIFVVLMRSHEKDLTLLTESRSRNADFLIMLLSYLQSNYAHTSLEEAASFFNYSPRHISRLIRENTGRSFGEIQRDLRMRRAAELLTVTDMTPAKIIEAVGYADVSTFYKAFKEYYGMNPAAWRKKHT